jgi:hypothetical protein
MHSAEARVTTDRAERYLDQLCSHLGQMQHMRHLPRSGHGGAGVPRVEQVERTPGGAVIRFADGSWSLRTASDALVLRVEADDPAALDRLKTAIAARIAKIGRRDQLAVEWREADTPQVRDLPGYAEAGRPGRRGWRRAGWIAAVAVVVAVHLGLVGSLAGSGRWKELAADVVLALIAVKLVLLGLHARYGRGASSRR